MQIVAVETAGRRVREYAAAVGAAEDDVITLTGLQEVIAADGEVHRAGLADNARQAVGLVPEATPAEHLHHIAGGILVLDPAAVTEDDVVVAAALDIVLALAAEDHQRQRGSRSVDGVVVGPGRAGVVVVVRSLRVDGEELVSDGAERHGHRVVAEASVEEREGAHVEPADLRAGVFARAGNGYNVVGVAAPDRDAAGIGAAVAERVQARRRVIDVDGCQAMDLILRHHHP